MTEIEIKKATNESMSDTEEDIEIGGRHKMTFAELLEDVERSISSGQSKMNAVFVSVQNLSDKELLTVVEDVIYVHRKSMMLDCNRLSDIEILDRESISMAFRRIISEVLRKSLSDRQIRAWRRPDDIGKRQKI